MLLDDRLAAEMSQSERDAKPIERDRQCRVELRKQAEPARKRASNLTVQGLIIHHSNRAEPAEIARIPVGRNGIL